MDIRQLEAFVNVINLKSFSAAAKELYLTQPTISAHIVSLEEELNTKLLVRTTREVYPTKVGLVLLKYAQEILEIREKAIEAVLDFETSMDGEIVIAASTIPYNYFLPKTIDLFSVKNPKVSFNVIKSDSISVIKMIEQRKAEIGIVGTTIDSQKCEFHSFNGDRLVIIAPNTLYYKTKFSKGYSIQRLLKEPFISREKGSGTRKEAEYLLKEVGVDISKINIIAEMSDNESIINAVGSGAGVAVISSCVAEEKRTESNILLFELENSKRTRKLYLVKHKLDPLSPVAEEFYNFSVKYFQTNNKFPY